MDRLIYSALSGMRSSMEKQRVLASNMANAVLRIFEPIFLLFLIFCPMAPRQYLLVFELLRLLLDLLQNRNDLLVDRFAAHNLDGGL